MFVVNGKIPPNTYIDIGYKSIQCNGCGIFGFTKVWTEINIINSKNLMVVIGIEAKQRRTLSFGNSHFAVFAPRFQSWKFPNKR